MPPKLLLTSSKALMSYLRCTCIMSMNSLTKIHHTTDMAQIPADSLNGLNSANLSDKVAGHQSAHLNTMEECFRNIHAFGTGYETAKGYSRADFDAPDALTISGVRSTKEQGPCFKCSGLHYQNMYTKYKEHFTLTASSRTTGRATISTSSKNNHNSGQFTTGTLSLQVSHQSKPGDDTALSANTIKAFPWQDRWEIYTTEEIKYFIQMLLIHKMSWWMK